MKKRKFLVSLLIALLVGSAVAPGTEVLAADSTYTDEQKASVSEGLKQAVAEVPVSVDADYSGNGTQYLLQGDGISGSLYFVRFQDAWEAAVTGQCVNLTNYNAALKEIWDLSMSSELATQLSGSGMSFTAPSSYESYDKFVEFWKETTETLSSMGFSNPVDPIQKLDGENYTIRMASDTVNIGASESSQTVLSKKSKDDYAINDSTLSTTDDSDFEMTVPSGKTITLQFAEGDGNYAEPSQQTVTINCGIEVENGGTLIFGGKGTYGKNTQAKITFNEPIKVAEGGKLVINDSRGLPTLTDELIFAGDEDAFITGGKGSDITLTGIDMASENESAAATVKTDGKLTLQSHSKDVSLNKVVVTENGSLELKTLNGGEDGTGSELDTKIVVNDLEVSGGSATIPETERVELDSVEASNSATITVPENSTTSIKATTGSKIVKNTTTITAPATEGTVEQNSDGSITMPKATTVSFGDNTTTVEEPSVLSGSKLLQGADGKAPTKNEDNSYDIPAGGAVTDITTNEVTEMPIGGSVDGSTGEVVVKANSISLNRANAYLYHNTDNNTVQLSATVDPASVPVTWMSSDPSVASVDQKGLVTAHKEGTATITATCTVNVSTYVYTGKYSYEVFTSVGDNGTLTVDRYATEGDKVTIEVAPDEAYLLDELVVTANGKEVELTDNGDGTYTFTMPSADVRISATFAEDPDWTEPEEPATDVSDIFIDVAPNAWYKDAVQYAYAGGLMTGVSANEFAPDATTTRGMIVSMLARLEGVESANDAGFADVSDEWYATAVNWAASVGVVNGYEDGTFRPNDAITREQLAAILMNYAAYKGQDVSARASLDAYSDAENVSTWATDTMSWAVAEGYITGMTADTLQPQGSATRAQVAAILERFLAE